MRMYLRRIYKILKLLSHKLFSIKHTRDGTLPRISTRQFITESERGELLVPLVLRAKVSEISREWKNDF